MSTIPENKYNRSIYSACRNPIWPNLLGKLKVLLLRLNVGIQFKQESGASCQNWTDNLIITSDAFYQLN